MRVRLRERLCVITAAGAGLGGATVLALARENASVLATDSSGAARQSLARDDESVQTAALNVMEPD